MDNYTPMNKTPCKYFFDISKKCMFGNECFFSHDPILYMAINQLKKCPNCKVKFCRGRQCKSCHKLMVASKTHL